MDKSVDSFETKTASVQETAFKTMMSIIKDLKLKNGKIKPTKENLRLVTVKAKKIFTPKYKKAVKDLLEGMDTTTNLTDEYFGSIRRP